MEKKSRPQEPAAVKIIHRMADGSVRDRIDGYVIPLQEHTAVCCRLLAKYAENHSEGKDPP